MKYFASSKLPSAKFHRVLHHKMNDPFFSIWQFTLKGGLPNFPLFSNEEVLFSDAIKPFKSSKQFVPYLHTKAHLSTQTNQTDSKNSKINIIHQRYTPIYSIKQTLR